LSGDVGGEKMVIPESGFLAVRNIFNKAGILNAVWSEIAAA
jgi:uncharacterized protein (DUF362 family)